MTDDEKPFAVVGPNGSGWGRYATHAEAQARADSLKLMDGVEYRVARVLS